MHFISRQGSWYGDSKIVPLLGRFLLLIISSLIPCIHIFTGKMLEYYSKPIPSLSRVLTSEFSDDPHC